MTAALQKVLSNRLPIVTSAFLIGSVAPDISLYSLSLSAALYYRYVQGWSAQTTFRYMYDYLFFHNPWWISLHNLLHSPTLLIMALSALRFLDYQRAGWSRWFFWFLPACLFHSAVDVFTHVDDGPLLFFPFEWTIRFNSPVSYWDSRHYGMQFSIFELVLDVMLLIYLFGQRIRARLSAKAPSP